jgi:membrane protein implicated in regulation of membrane protease activity
MDWIEALTGLQKAFFIIGVIGSTVFLIQFVLMLIGGDSHGDADVPVDASGAGDSATEVMAADMDTSDADFSGAPHGTEVDAVHADSDLGLKLLSIQSLSVFLMMFGLVGLAVSKGGKYGDGVAFVAGIGVGFLFMYLVAKMFAFFKSLQNSGTLDLRNAIGHEARVYLTIKPQEPGQVEIVVQEHLKILSARSKDNSRIPTDARVRVVRVANNVLIVEPVVSNGKD